MHFKYTVLVYPLIYTYIHMLETCPAAFPSPIKLVKIECKLDEEIKEQKGQGY